jgi:hypothetical protein
LLALGGTLTFFRSIVGGIDTISSFGGTLIE